MPFRVRGGCFYLDYLFVNRKFYFFFLEISQVVSTFSHAIASSPRPPSPRGQSPCPSKTVWQRLSLRCWLSCGEVACNTLA
nr:MAG TPA: hypothetical protein [Inoviridae sp.]